jgi:hypothetical protein
MSDAPRRIQRQRTRGWRMPPNTVYVGRRTMWANPYFIDADCQHLSWFRADLELERGAERAPTVANSRLSALFWRMARRLSDLRGKHLACWCRLDQPCHADVLLELANAPLRCEATDD